MADLYLSRTSRRTVLVLVILAVVTLPLERSTAIAAGPPLSTSLFPLQLEWMLDLGSAPVAKPVHDDVHAYIPLQGGTLTAVRLSDGKVIWSIEQPTRFSAATGAGIVVVADATALVALRANDAQILWRVDTGSPVSAAPLWNSGWLVVMLESGEVVALRGVDGHEFWRLPLHGALHVQPSVGGTELFVPVDDGRIVALDLQTGTRLWERTLGGSPQEILPLDAIFVGATDNYLYRLSRRNGSVDWRWRTGGDIVGIPAVDQDRVFFLSLDNILRSLDRGSGVQRWRQPLAGRPTSGPLLVGDVLLVSGVAPLLRAFDPATGRPANRLHAPGELAAPPLLQAATADVGLKLVLTIADGRLAAMRPAFGPPQFSLGFPPPPLLPGPRQLPLADVPPFQAATSPDTSDPAQPDVLTVEPAADRDLAELPQPAVQDFTVQVAALRSATAAEVLADRLVENGFDAYADDSSGTDGLYQVRVGRGLSRLKADEIAGRLAQEERLDTYLIQVP